MRRILGTLAATLLASTANADVPAAGGVPVVESYTEGRPDEADDRLRPMFDVFAERGALFGAALTDALAPHSRAGISITDEELKQLGPTVDSAYNVLYKAEDETALQRAALMFKAAMTLADGATAVLASDDLQRRAALRAHVGLALAFRRLSEAVRQRKTNRDPAGADKYKALAEQTMERAVLAFPGMEPDAAQGREAPEWWSTVRKRLRAGATGTLVVDPGNDGAIVFVAEAFAGRGLTTKTDLPAATYRVYTERATTMGRVRTVEVRPREVTRLILDWSFDAALHTGPAVWLEFEEPGEHREKRGIYAGRIATMVGQRYAVIVGLSSRREGDHTWRVAWGLTVDTTGRVRVSGEVPFDDDDPDGTEAILRQFASLLLTPGGPTRRAPVDGIGPLDLDADPLPWAEPVLAAASPERGSGVAGPVLAWTSLGVSVGALGAGLVWGAADGDCIATADDPCGKIRTTKSEAIAAASAGVTLGAVTGYLWGRQRPTQRRLLRGKWVWIAGGLSLGAVTGGIGLMTYDERSTVVGDGDTNQGLRPYRSTLGVGNVVAAVGAFGLGFSIYSALGPDDETALMPTVNVSADGAAVSIAGRF